MPRKLTAYDFALWAALPMAKSSRIEGRLKMILNSNTRPRALPRHFLGYALMVGAAMVVPLALLHPAARAQSAPLPAKKPHLSKAMAQVSAVSAIPGETDAIELARKGRSLTPQAAAELERKIAAHPDDYIAHILLLCYDETKSYKAGPGRTAYQQQVFWLIRKHPESVMNGANTMLLKRDDANAFEQGKTLWLEQIAAQPTNTVILGKAASYCLISDNQTAERLLRQAETLEPKNPHWPERIGFLYQLQAENSSGEIKRSLASKALTEYEAAAEISTNKSLQHSTSADLARTAFDAGEYDKARHYATLLLRRSLNKNGESWTPSGDTHQAHLNFRSLGPARWRHGTSRATSAGNGPHLRLTFACFIRSQYAACQRVAGQRRPPSCVGLFRRMCSPLENRPPPSRPVESADTTRKNA
jgi:tetratricopeptide (TPR) repeat protein